MRDTFPAQFRPAPDELSELWKHSTFAIDANVLLNLYRYSPATRSELEAALKSVEARLFLPHQAAREFFRNRLSVTVGQAEEYSKAVKTIDELAANLADHKRHPFIPEEALPRFSEQVDTLKTLLNQQRETLLRRLTQDEILDGLERMFAGRTGEAFSGTEVAEIIAEGEGRYAREVPPGFKDGKKDAAGDDSRRFGDLILWKQLIKRATTDKRPLIFVTDDKKEDWWLQLSGRTVGPRTELREEFLAAGCKEFWMYTVELFIAEAAKTRQASVSQQVIDEVKTIREEIQSRPRYRSISRGEMLKRVADSEEWARTKAEGFVGVHSFVITHLGGAGYEYDSAFDCLDELARDGLVEYYDHQGPGHARPVRAVRLVQTPPLARQADAGLEH